MPSTVRKLSNEWLQAKKKSLARKLQSSPIQTLFDTFLCDLDTSRHGHLLLTDKTTDDNVEQCSKPAKTRGVIIQVLFQTWTSALCNGRSIGDCERRLQLVSEQRLWRYTSTCKAKYMTTATCLLSYIPVTIQGIFISLSPFRRYLSRPLQS